MLCDFAILDPKCSATFSADPNVTVRAACDCVHRARRGRQLDWLQRIAVVEQPSVSHSCARARPQASLRISFERIDKEAPRLADNFFCFAVFDQEQTAALRAGVKFFVNEGEA